MDVHRLQYRRSLVDSSQFAHIAPSSFRWDSGKEKEMKRFHKYAIGFTGIVMAGTLALGTVASAGNGNGNGNGEGGGGMRQRDRIQLTDEQKCELREQIEMRAVTFLERLTERIANVEARLAAAQEAGDTALVTRLEARLERLETVQTRATERLANFQTWADENCE